MALQQMFISLLEQSPLGINRVEGVDGADSMLNFDSSIQEKKGVILAPCYCISL